ncbi:hypothetical protein MPDQ_005864, partial [Monascus purpureus]
MSSPSTNVFYESECNTYHNSFVGEERRILVLVDQLKIKAICQCHLACLPKLSFNLSLTFASCHKLCSLTATSR